MATRTENAGVDQEAIACAWRGRGFSCGLWVDPPGQVWANYAHETDELVMVQGEVVFEIEGQVHHPALGRELFIPAHARHTVRNLGRGQARWLYGYRS
jgi:quercetin dioxygenase-like cupin family protein